METSIYLATALNAMHAGCSVVPPRQDGSKRPVGSWKQFQDAPADEAQIRHWYANGRSGVGVVLGAVSGGLEMFEFEDIATFDAFVARARDANLTPLIGRINRGYCEATPGGGIHWFYRCAAIGGNTKLARRPKRPDEQADDHDTINVLIETRGEGGFGIVAPSDGPVHPSGRGYELLCGGWESIVTITPEERESLFELARSFDEVPPRPVIEPRAESREPDGDRPGDRFNARMAWGDILGPHGWAPVFRNGEATYWRRPGKREGWSASTNFGGSDLLWVWSTSTVFDSEVSYTKFGAYTVLEHGGDFTAAGRALRAQDLGAGGNLVRHGTVRDILDAATLAAEHGDGDDQDEDTPAERQRRFEIVDGPEFLLRPPMRWVIRGVIPEGAFVCLLGQPGSYKTFVALDLALCMATGTRFLNRATRRGNVLYIAAEGAGGFSKRMKAWARRRVAIPRSFKILPGVVPLLDARAVADLILDVRSFGEPFDLIVVDTLSRSMPGADENASRDMTAAVAAAEALQHELGCVVVVLHHGVKQDGTAPKSPRGHSSLPGALDTIIVCEREANGETIKVSCSKQKDGEEFAPLFLRRVVVDVGDGRPVDPEDEDQDEDADAEPPTSVVLELLPDEEQQIRRGVTSGKGLTVAQYQLLRLLFQTFGIEGATQRQWYDAAKAIGYGRNSYQDFKNRVGQLCRRGLVVIRAGSDSERYVADQRVPTILEQYKPDGLEDADAGLLVADMDREDTHDV